MDRKDLLIDVFLFTYLLILLSSWPVIHDASHSGDVRGDSYIDLNGK